LNGRPSPMAADRGSDRWHRGYGVGSIKPVVAHSREPTPASGSSGANREGRPGFLGGVPAFRESDTGEVRGTPLPRTPVNRCEGEGLGRYARSAADLGGSATTTQLRWRCPTSGAFRARSAASASAEPSHTGPDLPHPRQWAIFFLPPPTVNTSTGKESCSQCPRLVARLVRSKAFLPVESGVNRGPLRGRSHPPCGLSLARFRDSPFPALRRMVPKGEAEPGVRRGPRAPASRAPAARRGGPGSTPAAPGGLPTRRGSGSRGTSPSARNGRPPNRSCRPGPSSGRETPCSPIHPVFASRCSSIGLRLDATLAGRGSEGGSSPPAREGNGCIIRPRGC